MNTLDNDLVQEGLQILNDAINHFDEDSSHPMVKVIAKLLHSAITIGQSIVGGK